MKRHINTDLMDNEAQRARKNLGADHVLLLVSRDGECAMGSTYSCPIDTMEAMNDAARELIKAFPEGCHCYSVSWDAWKRKQTN